MQRSAPLDKPATSNWRSCGICCLGFSLFAIVFLMVVGAVIKSGSESIAMDPEKRDHAASNCYVGAGIYAGFVVLSLTCIFLPPFLCPPKREEQASLVEDYRVNL